ncbi:hypothetical protein T484DRAFT_1946159 [Baffinella frigidus]|nr:hypothetical protein T484DRAFT_1946159 [Cryptophyta sp. CCMP2293]
MLEERELAEAVRGLGSLDASEREAWVYVLLSRAGGQGGGEAGWDAVTSAILDSVETTKWSLLRSDRLRCESAARVLANAEWSAMPETSAAACRFLFSLAEEGDEQMRAFAIAGLVAAAMHPHTGGSGVVREKVVSLLRAGDVSALKPLSPLVEAVSGEPRIEEEVQRLIREACAREDGGGADVLEAALEALTFARPGDPAPVAVLCKILEWGHARSARAPLALAALPLMERLAPRPLAASSPLADVLLLAVAAGRRQVGKTAGRVLVELSGEDNAGMLESVVAMSERSAGSDRALCGTLRVLRDLVPPWHPRGARVAAGAACARDLRTSVAAGECLLQLVPPPRRDPSPPDHREELGGEGEAGSWEEAGGGEDGSVWDSVAEDLLRCLAGQQHSKVQEMVGLVLGRLAARGWGCATPGLPARVVHVLTARADAALNTNPAVIEALALALSSYHDPPPAAAALLVRAVRSGGAGARRAAIRGVCRVDGGMWVWRNDAALAALVHAASEEEEEGPAGYGAALFPPPQRWSVDVRGAAVMGLRRAVGASLQRGDGRAGCVPRDGEEVVGIAMGELGERRALAVCMASLPRQAGGCLVALLHVDVVRMVVALECA